MSTDGRNWTAILRSPEYRAMSKDSAPRVYIRIMAAQENGRGVRLTADEVDSVSADDAISTAATTAIFGEGR